jgi:hypothetical protein
MLNAPGWVIMPEHEAMLRFAHRERQRRPKTETSLPSDFANSEANPPAPNSRFQPSRIDMRDSFGAMRSSDARRVLAHRCRDAGAHQRQQHGGKRLSDLEKNSPKKIDDVIPCQVAGRLAFRGSLTGVAEFDRTIPGKKTVKIRIATNEARIAASFECGSWPFSTASRIFLSVASSVLLSLSTDWPCVIRSAPE